MSQERVDNLFASESWSAVYTAFTNVSLKAYDFDTIRDALLLYIKQTYPDKYNDFIASSEFIAVLDLVAYLGHSLSYRLDMNTRENFLGLAERKESVLRIAKSMGYNKTRPINARGFMKITSIRTDEDIFDSNGISLANRSINWNDSNDTEWYENFITVINAALDDNTKIQNPKASLKISTVDHKLYEIKENTSSKSVVYGFKSNLAGKNRTLEAVRAGFEDDTVIEMQPDRTKNFTIINRDDNLGPASDRTGFFVFTKLGKLSSTTYNYTMNISNRVQTVAKNNISNTDVWIQKINSAGAIVGEVVKVDNDTRETAIYNSLRSGTSDIVSVNTTIDNGVELHYPDGIFGNSAFGNYRVWYRVVDNESYSVDRTSIENADIAIPYIGADGLSHTLRLTLSTTRDFAENYEAENFISVKRIAPRSYYSQDRMVNGQDYNVLPLSLGSNVVKKVKAINTNFSGNSRYFEMDDVTGHHSNVTVNANDGSMYLDDDVITSKLQFNKEYGNSINFIRNEISKVLKHGSLSNHYYITNSSNPEVVINEETRPELKNNTSWPVYIEIDPTNPKTIFYNRFPEPDPGEEEHPAERMYPGDFIKIKSISENGAVEKYYWTRIYGAKQSGGGTSNTSYIIKDIIPETNSELYIVEIVKGFRTRFEQSEILEIKNWAFDNDTVSSFIIKYVYDSENDRWVWTIHGDDETYELTPGLQTYVELSYNQGIRAADAEYKAKFWGKKVVFESTDAVKFFYNNPNKSVNLETNLAVQDKIILDYYRPGENDVSGGSEVDATVTLGHSKIYNYSLEGTVATFDLYYKSWSGAPDNLAFVQNQVDYGLRQPADAMSFKLETKSGGIFDITSGVNNDGYSTPIGNRENDEYTLPVTVDISDIVIDDVSDPVTNEAPILETTEFELSDTLTVVAETGNVANADSTLISLSSTDFDSDDFGGSVSTSYFETARSSKNFVFVNAEDLTDGHTPSTITIEDPTNVPSGIVDDFIVFKTDPSSTTYQFQFANGILPAESTSVFWKQFAYAEIQFDSTRELSISTIVVKLDNTIRVDTKHLELIETSNDGDNFSYRLIFWTYDPGTSVIDVYDIYTTSGGAGFEDFIVRAESAVKINRTTTLSIPAYRTSSSFIYDVYTDEKGYNDYTKVKLTTMDTDKNPLGMVDVIGSDRYLITEMVPNSSTFKISDLAIVTNDPSDIKQEYYVYYNTEAKEWYNNLGISLNGGYISLNSDSTYIELINDQGTIPSGTRLKLVNGISNRNNTLARYIWDHYADIDKRIDPSTSNIVDVYVLTADYTRKIEAWKNSGFAGQMPKAANNYELKKLMENIKGKESISDHVSYVPVRFKPLFGSQASQENQAIFKVVKKSGTLFTDSEIKSGVSAAVNNFFKLENWDFGDTFYFSELAAHIHKECAELISSVVITPKYSGSEFTKLLSITSEPNEIFMSVTTSTDVKIIERITDLELSGE